MIDFAHKVVGVGSVGLRAYVALLDGRVPTTSCFWQLKQASARCLRHTFTVIQPGMPPGTTACGISSGAADGQRPVAWLDNHQRPPVLRAQFRDRRAASPSMRSTLRRSRLPPALPPHAGEGTCRTSGASMIAGYIGSSDKLDRAMWRFACATQTRPRLTIKLCLKPCARHLRVAESPDICRATGASGSFRRR